MKKFLSLIILGIFCMNKINADTTWNLSGDGTLTISGTGEVSYNNQCPKADIKTLVIGNGVTSIASYTFKDCNALTSITFGNSIESIGVEAFRNCTALASLSLPNSLTTIGYDAFRNIGVR